MKNCFLTKCLCGIAALVLIVSCQSPLDDLQDFTGSLVIKLSDETSRTLLPDLDMKVASWRISGAGPAGASFSEESAGSTLTVESLPFGDWIITAEALNSSGTAIGSGSSEVRVKTGETAEVAISVVPYSGLGSLELKVVWNTADIDVPSVKAELTPVNGDASELSFVLAEGKAEYSSQDLPAGYYALSVQLLDNGIVVMGAVEIVRVAHGSRTSGLFEFTEVNKPGGKIDVTVTGDLQDPLEVTITGLTATLSGAKTMELQASNTAGLNAAYVWYLNGQSRAVGANWSVGALPDGVYRVDVTAISADGKRAGSASGSFRASGTIDLSSYIKIHQIQGASHVSPYENQQVSCVVGVVTAKDNKGFWMQSPVEDADPATSEGLLVYFNSAPAVDIGDLVVVSGTVKEYGFNNELRLTELTAPTVSATLAKAFPLPAAVVIGTGGRVPPAAIICDDGNISAQSVFDPENDGIDFWESLEGMQIRLNDTVVTGSGKFGELAVIAENRSAVLPERRTARGGVSIAEGNYNPPVLLMDTDAPLLNLPALEAVTGDRFADPVVGILTYSYGNYMLLPTASLSLLPRVLDREVSTLLPAVDRLTVATFNIENFPRSEDTMTPAQIDEKVADIAATIVQGMHSPDIVVIEEMTDDSWSANNGVVSARGNFDRLIAAIVAAGGPATYQFRQIDPENNQEGGWAGANIRVGFLFNGARVGFVDVPGGDAITGISAEMRDGRLRLSASPGRVAPASFANSRKPLAGHFVFNGRDIIVIGNHFASKGGDDPLWGVNQPPILASETERLVQVRAVNEFVASLLALDPSAAVVVAGDFNDFAFSNPVRALQGGLLRNLVDELLPSAERYTYVFDGNSQQLDHIVVSANLFDSEPQVDVVHRYAEYPHSVRHTDHDPVLASFRIVSDGSVLPPAWISGYPALDGIVETGATLLLKLDSAGTVCWKLQPGGSAIPSPAEIQGANSASILSMEEFSVPLAGLIADSAYDLYVMAGSASGVWQYGAQKIAFRTSAPAISQPVGLSGLFFSDYGEGSSNNKYLELYNASGSPVELSGADGAARFFMLLAANGAQLASGMTVYKFPAGMTIASEGMVGIYNSSAVAAIKDKLGADRSFASTVTYFNGDDAIVLVQDLNGNGSFELGTDAVLDVFGRPGDATKYILDLGMRRKPEFRTGSASWDASQWIQYTRAEVDSGAFYGVHP